MLKFLSDLRRPLLESGKVKSYILYALGEIVLVVVGILIALQVNNWNESRKQDITEAAFIAGIKNDLRQDREYIGRIVDRAEEKNAVYDRISQELFHYYDTNRPALDSLLVEYFKSQGTFYPISGSFQAAISGNELSKFKNKEFSHAVTSLYNSTYARLMDNAKDTDDRWHYFTKKYSRIRRTGHIPEMSPAELSEFLDDMYYHVFGLNYYRHNLNRAGAKIDSILSQ